MRSESPIRWIVKLLWKEARWSFIFVTLLALSGALLSAASIHTLKLLIDEGTLAVKGAGGNRIVLLSITYVIFALILPNIISTLLQMSREIMQKKTQIALSNKVLAKSADVGLDEIENPKFQDMLSIVSKADSSHVTNYWNSLFSMVVASVQIVSIGSVLFLFHWSIPILMLMAISPELIIRLRAAKEQHRTTLDLSEKERKTSYYFNLLIERNHIKEIRSYDIVHFLQNRWKSYRVLVQDVRLDFDRRNQIKINLGRLALVVMLFACLSITMTLVLYAHASIGSLISTLFSLDRLLGPILNMMNETSSLRQSSLLIFTVMEFLGRPSSSHNTGISASLTDRNKDDPLEIEFKDVSFSYPDTDGRVIDNISFQIKAGEKIALVGANGSGKTTLIRLLLGLSCPTSGEIQINNQLIPMNGSQSDTQSTVVFQDFCKFKRTIRENIGYGHLPDLYDNSRLDVAAEEGGALTFIRQLPNAYEQQLGSEFPEGIDLSGGQWQRLAISRSYLRPSGLLIMDEPTAALDPVSEMEVYRQFSELARNRTAIIVSHRLGSATLADQIFFIKDGRIIEKGSHHNLLQLNGEYAAMFRSQASWYSVEVGVGRNFTSL